MYKTPVYIKENEIYYIVQIKLRENTIFKNN